MTGSPLAGGPVHLVLPRYTAAGAAYLLVQLSTLFPEISIAIPFGPTLASWNTNDLITPMTAAIAGLALNEAAYMAEIIRGGLLSVDKGQVETTEAFGMTRRARLWRIIIPQAMRSIVPPTGNQLISMIKATSLVSVIAMADLLYSVQADIQSHLRGHPDADGCGHLVSVHHIDPQCRPGLHRALLRPW